MSSRSFSHGLIPFWIASTMLMSHAGAQDPANQTGHGIRFLPANIPAPVVPKLSDEALRQQTESQKSKEIAVERQAPQSWDLVENSEFITFQREVLIVPKGAILHIPERLQAHVIENPVGKIQPWLEFISKNRAHITTVEVTLDQATGKAALPEQRVEEFKNSSQIVIATFNRHPISVASPSPIQPPSNSP